nr:DNA-directed DNA polymerase [Tanacetum cinerariifolium]
MLRACPHHEFSKLTQIDMFYNGLTEQDQDSLNAAAGGNLLNKTTRETLKMIENKSKVRYSRSKSNVSRVNTNSRESVSKTDDRIDKLADQILNLVENVKIQVITPAKAVEKTCVTCGGAHAYYDCIATDSTLLSNIVPNPKGEMKAITTRSGLAYEGPSIPTNSPLEKVDEQNSEETMNKDHSNCPGSTAQVQPPIVPISISKPDVPRTQMKPTIPYLSRLNDQKLRASINLMPWSNWKKFSLPELTPTRMTLELADRSITCPKRVTEDVFVKVGMFHFPTDFVVVDFEADPRVPLILGTSFLKTGRALIDVYGEEITLRVNDESVTFNLNQTMRYSSTYDNNSVNPIDVIDIACEEFVQDVLDFQYNPKSSNPTLVSDSSISESDFSKEPIVKSSSPIVTLFGESAEESKAKSSAEEPPELELKDLPSHLEYDFLEDSNKLPVIIAKDLKDVEKEALINVLKSHKRAIAWKIFDIKGIDPRFCTHKILMEEDYKPAVQSQRRVNLKIHDVIKKEVIKFLDADMIYPISDSPWVSPIYCVPKKGGMNVVANENNELIPTRLVTGWRVCIDYRKLNDATRKDHFPLPFMDQMLERLAGNELYCFLDRPMTHLLEKETPFVFSKECVDAFNTWKKKLTEAPILVVPDWNLPFELMCDASDFAIGAVLGQRKTKHFQPIHYASKTVTEAQIYYTTTEKEMLVVVYAFEKFRPYLVLSKSIVYTDHSALKYLLNKQDAKPRAIISDRGIHFCNDQFTRVMIKYGVTHRLATAYHPQTSGHVEVSNRGLKRILERTVAENRTSWAYWALKHVNFDLKTMGDHHKLQLNELSELRDQAYENSVIYKERTKKLHDSKIKNRIFNVGDQVLLFNSRLKIFSRKLKTRWSGPFTITQVFLYGTIELSQPNGPNFKVNGHRVKHYFEGFNPSMIEVSRVRIVVPVHKSFTSFVCN